MDNNRTDKDNLRTDIVNGSDLDINMHSDTTKLKKDRPQNKNLISLADRTAEERKEIGRKGGLKSAETRRKRQTMKETILAMLSQELKPEQIEQYGIDPETLNGDYTMQSALIASMLREALNGSERAAQLLRDTIDEAPTNRQEIRQEVITADDLQTIDNLKKYLTG